MLTRRLFQLAVAAVLAVASVQGSAEETKKVGSSPAGVPFSFLDTGTNTIKGIMVDLMTAVGKESGFKVDVSGIQFSSLIPALTSKKIDIIAAAMFITPQRRQVIEFSEPVYTYGEGLVVPESDTGEYVKFEDLKGRAVGAQVGTAFIEPLKATGYFTEVRVYDTIPDLVADVRAGRIAAGFADQPILAYNIQQKTFSGVRLVKSYKPIIVGSVGIGVRKDERELLSKINASIAKLKADGTFDAILTKWGLQK